MMEVHDKIEVLKKCIKICTSSTSTDRLISKDFGDFEFITLSPKGNSHNSSVKYNNEMLLHITNDINRIPPIWLKHVQRDPGTLLYTSGVLTFHSDKEVHSINLKEYHDADKDQKFNLSLLYPEEVLQYIEIFYALQEVISFRTVYIRVQNMYNNFDKLKEFIYTLHEEDYNAPVRN